MDGIIDDSRHKTNITLSNVAHEALGGIDPVQEPVALKCAIQVRNGAKITMT